MRFDPEPGGREELSVAGPFPPTSVALAAPCTLLPALPVKLPFSSPLAPFYPTSSNLSPGYSGIRSSPPAGRVRRVWWLRVAFELREIVLTARRSVRVASIH